jgi:Cytochrome c oxidase subunit III
MKQALPPRRNHFYHLVEPSPWPFFVSICSFLVTSSMVFFFHRIEGGGFLLCYSFILLLACVFFWFRDIILEATYLGQHTTIVKMGLKKGFFVFIISEIMLFFGFF